MKILGIESSCDETAAAVVEGRRILSSAVAVQHDVHARFGGVVPELASRRHMECICPVIRCALSEAGLSLDSIEGVAATNAPGLLGSLLVGLAAAKGIAFARDILFIGVNHLEGHLNAAALEFDDIPLPHVGLIASGGHTSLYLVRGFGDYILLGATRDDAAGEAFDKVAALLGLGFPGGPAIEEAAAGGDPRAFKFSAPRFSSKSVHDFSFSGIKTAALLIHRREAKAAGREFVRDMAASFQEAVVGVLVDRLISAAREFNAKAVLIAGGVAANSRLRRRLTEAAAEVRLPSFIPSTALCTDNAAMIAHVGARRLALGEKSDLSLDAVANEEIGRVWQPKADRG